MKRLLVVTVVMALLAMPLSLFAKDQFAVGKILAQGATSLIVPLEIANADNLVALDLPLRFSEGVTLKEVDFVNTRIEYFDFKISNINNEENTVIIGALPQMSSVVKPDLKAGSGVIANLVFEINDPAITSVKIEAIEMTDPFHTLMFVYHDYNDDGSIAAIRAEYPEFGTSVAFDNLTEVLPTVYNLEQNYPNPFNPSTDIAFALPNAGQVKLVVYNILGQEVTTLIDGHMEAGNHSVTFEADNYSSGVYFYRLNAERYTQTLKMMLLK
jgi:hypothetical protein